MRKSLNNLTIILLCLIITLSSINIGVLVENIDISSIVDLFDFHTPVKEELPPYEKNSLVITASGNNINTYGAYEAWTNGNIHILKYKNEEQCKNAYEKLKNDENIESIEYDGTYKIATNDKTYQAKNFMQAPINAPYIGENTSNGINSIKEDDVVVAIIDTGYDLEQKSDRIINTGANFSKDAKDNSIQDENGHGTSMANIILDNSSENVKVMPIKVADKDGLALTSSIYKAIMYSVEQKVDVINISMASYKSEKSELIKRAVAKAKEQGIFVVVSAGNENSDVAEYTPASSSDAITVSAVNSNKEKMAYSNYGEEVDFSAYGKVEAKTIGREKVKVDGTSVSSAIVSLIIAQYKVENRSSSYEDIYNALIKSAEDLGDSGKDSVYGYGVLCRDNIEGLESFTKSEKPALYTADWKNMSDEELDGIISESSHYVVAKFIEQLNEEDKELLLSKDTMLCQQYSMESNEENTVQKFERYYDYIKTIDTDIAQIQADAITVLSLDHYTTSTSWLRSTLQITWDGGGYGVKHWGINGDFEFISDSQVNASNPKHTITTINGGHYFQGNFNLKNCGIHARGSIGSKTEGLNGDFTNIGDAGTSIKCTGSSTKIKNIGLQFYVEGRPVSPGVVSFHTKQNKTSSKTVAATCTTGGEEYFNCKYCDAKNWLGKTTPALGHDYKDTVTAPTCTAQGYTTHTCSRGDSTYNDTYTGPLGHINPGSVYSNPAWYTYENNNGIINGRANGYCMRSCGTIVDYMYKVVVTPGTGISSAWPDAEYHHAGDYVSLGANLRNAYDLYGYTTGNPFTMPGYAINATALAVLALKNVNGAVIWNDQSNKFSSRPGSVTLTLHDGGDPGYYLLDGPDANPINVTSAQNVNAYTFVNTQARRQYDNSNYPYSVSQNQVIPGYQTTVGGFNITNTLILPTYQASVTYTPIDTFRGMLLRNGKAKLTAEASQTTTSDARAGLHSGVAKFTIDNDITIDPSTIKIKFYDASTNQTTNITNYSLSNNIITVKFGQDASGISEKGDKITIEVEGKLTKIGTYQSNMEVTGYLRDVSVNTLTQAQRNTSINLGVVASANNNPDATTNGKPPVPYQMPQAKIEIAKRDSITEGSLTNATFKLYEWNGEDYVEKETLTDSNNDGIYESKYYEWNVTTNGQYKVVETGIPTNHKELNFNLEYILNQLHPENYVVKPDYNDHTQVTKIQYGVRNPDDLDSEYGVIENEPYKIKAQVEVLDEETLKQIVSDTKFRIYEWDNQTNTYKIYNSYTRNVEVQMARQKNGTYLTDEWLYYTITNEGKYRIIEEQAPTGYYGDYIDDEGRQKRTYDINILNIVGQNGQNNETTIHLVNNSDKFINTRTLSQIKMNKIDDETKSFAQGDATLKGAEYEIYARENIYHADGSTARYEKEEGEAQGKYYRADELVATLQTNEQGQLTFENLECGKYYIKEKTPSEGYLLDKTTFDVDVTYRGETIKIVKEERTSQEQVIKQAFSITKTKPTDRNDSSVTEKLEGAGFTIYLISKFSIVQEGKVTKNEDGTYTLNDEQAQNDPLITIKKNTNGTYQIQDLVDYYYKKQYKEEEKDQIEHDDKSYFMYYTNKMESAKVKDYENSQQGVIIEELTTGIDGKITSPELAYGEYLILETSVPKNLDVARPFQITVKEDSRTPNDKLVIVDGNFEARIKIIKQDAHSQNTVQKAGIPYVIYDEEGQLKTYKTLDPTTSYPIEYGTLENPFHTNKDGYYITPMELPVGKYTIQELQAPDGYVLSGNEGYSENGQTILKPAAQTTIEISTNGIYYVESWINNTIIIPVNQKNDPQVGTITIGAVGEYIKEITKDQNGKLNYTYEKRAIPGVTYEIRAKEDIKTIDGHRKTIHKKDEIVRTITTNEEGKAYGENLPQGKYYIVQTVAGEGFALNKTIKEFEVKYGVNNKELTQGTDEWKKEAERTPVVYLNDPNRNILEDPENDPYIDINERQQLEITINKQDADTSKPIEGTIIALYTAQDIKNEKTGETLIAKNQKIYEGTTNKEGKITITKEQNLPLNMYYIKETQASVGYVKNNQTNNIDGSYEKTQAKLKQVETTLQNQKTSINILKTDTNEMPIEQATLEIQDENQNVLATWKTTKEPKNIQGLTVGKTYKIVETKPATGYVTENPITFQINEQGQLQTDAQTKNTNTIIMKDDITKAKIHLLDKQTKNYIPGTIMQLIKKDEQGAEQIIDEWTTTNDAYYKEKLEIGKYIIRQTAIPQDLINNGYVLTKDQEIEIKDDKNVQEITIYQAVTTVEVNLLDKDTKELVPGQTMQIITKDENGNEQIIDEWTTTEEPHIIEKLPPGDYILKQKEITKETGNVTTSEIPFSVESKEETQKINMTQSVTKLQIEVIDKQTKEKITNLKFQIIKKDENGKETIVKEIQITEENNITERIPIGEYILRQLEDNVATRGYVKLKDVNIKIIDTEKTQKAILEQDCIKLEASIIDKQTKEHIIGATLVIQDQNGNIVGEAWVSDGKPHPILKLPVGKYLLVEEQAPTLKGYVKAAPVPFEIKEQEETQTVVMEQETTKAIIKVIDSETKEEKTEEKIIVKDEKGNTIAEIDPKNPKEIQKIPPGNYVVELENPIYGYKELHQKIQILDKVGLQEIIVELEREEFDIQVETWIGSIVKNSKTQYENKNQEQKIKKLDIKDKNIKTENIKITYKIRVKNNSKITGKVGKIINNIPSGMEFRASDNKGYWKEENGKIISTALADKILKEAAYVDLEITFRWKNGLENFGTKENNVEIGEVTSDIGWKESNLENNKAKSAGVIIGVSTGDMNLVWACWILLITLILIEVTVTKKLKIKKFGLHDRTLKYAKKYAKEQKKNKKQNK